MRFKDKTVLVTGGGTGMGRAAALRLAREGANVIVAGRRARELNEVVATIVAQGGKAIAVPTDVSDGEQVRALVAKAVATFGSLHMAWNNAGALGSFQMLHETSLAEFDAIVATNLRGVFLCMQYEIAAMLRLAIKGAIVNTSSWTAHGAMPGTAAYAATKAGLEALTRSTALELGKQGIRINNVSPGVIATPMSRAALGSEDAMRPFARHSALQRIGEPEDVADAVLWLLSDDARFITGQTLLVDGGFTLGGIRPWALNPS
jgi:NAD(P)-dependent dehydrogenase (short-subunit alcohol dehydrogenase family)